jgi:hypothetical protein
MKTRFFCDRCKKEFSMVEHYINASGEKTVIMGTCPCLKNYVPYNEVNDSYDSGYQDGYYDCSKEMK